MKKTEPKSKLIELVTALDKLSFVDHIDFEKKFRQLVSTLSITPPAKWELVLVYQNMVKQKKLSNNKELEKYLRKSSVRTSSGVSVITVLTKPYACPGNCIFCPDEASMPKSYLSNEPAAQRALGLGFDPVKMVQQRITALETNGHVVDKIELLVLGGSFTAYTDKYQKDFIRKCFWAANTCGKKKRAVKSLNEEQKINETARYRIIGITLETRPDEIDEPVIRQFRELGCTRVQIGIQHTNDKILKLCRRGHGVAESIKATRLLKENGFKVDHHFMPDLPGSTPARDLQMMREVFAGSDLAPDQVKLYPCVVNEYAPLQKWYEQGKYKPYSPQQLTRLLLEIKKITPPWVRINRLIRDIPAESITAGNKVTNLRQYLRQELDKNGDRCHCIRCREIGLNQNKVKKEIKPVLFIDQYEASGGVEYFISFEDKRREILLGFLRLRINGEENNPLFKTLENASLVRELHVYGQMVQTGAKSKEATQHQGLGKKLMKEAEKITKQNKLHKVAVISGVGVRGYYRKLGYRLSQTYMVKHI